MPVRREFKTQSSRLGVKSEKNAHTFNHVFRAE